MRNTLILIALSFTLLFSGCNYIVRRGGGTMNVEIPHNKKFINATWKDSDLFYITRDRRDGETAETFVMQESSNLGLIESQVIFTEK